MGDDKDLSIADAMDEAKDELNEIADGDGSDGDGSEGEPQPAEDGEDGEDGGNPDEEPDEDKPDEDDPDNGDDKDGVDEAGDKSDNPDETGDSPDKSGKDGEYTKERFDGLMSTFNKKVDDMANSHKVALQGVQDKLDEALKAKEPNKESDDLPEELQGADPETQQGFKIIMKALESKFSNNNKELLDKVKEAMNAPAIEKNERQSKVVAEIGELETKHGKEFTDNKKSIIDYAVKHDYQMGTLDLAFTAWKKDQEISTLKAKINGGKKVNDEVNKDDKKKGNIPAGGSDRGKETPKYDEKRDSDKSLSELFNEGLAD